jgi:hypothetical protein
MTEQQIHEAIEQMRVHALEIQLALRIDRLSDLGQPGG